MLNYLLLLLVCNVAHSAFFDGLRDFIFGTEWCGGKWVRANISGLREDIKTQVYGQPLLLPIILPALSTHLNPNHTPKKPLVFSFHGWPGTGKNYVADFIAKNIYAEGVKSQFRKSYHGRIHFPHKSELDKYKKMLQDDLRSQVSKCSQSLFVFDEIEKMPDGIFEVLKPYLDYNSHIDHLDFRRSIFIFLSNLGSPQIIKRCSELSKAGLRRDEYKIKDFEMSVMNASYNEEGGLQRSSLISHHLIDYVVPFLPLEKIHVEQCISTTAKHQHIDLDEESRIEIIDSLVFFPEPERLFSSSGCKNLDSKILFHNAKKKWISDEL